MYAQEIQSIVCGIIEFLGRQLAVIGDANIQDIIRSGITQLRTINCVACDAKEQVATILTNLQAGLEKINAKLEKQYFRESKKALKFTSPPPLLLSIDLLLAYLSSKKQQLVYLDSSKDFFNQLVGEYKSCFVSSLVKENNEQALKDLVRRELKINKHSISERINQGLATLSAPLAEHQINYLCTLFAAMGVQPTHARYLVSHLH